MQLFSLLPNSRRHFPQLLAVFLASLIAVPDGMQYGWSSPMIYRYQEHDAPFQINNQHIQWVEISYTLSGLLGLPVTIHLVDRIGRKNTILSAACCCAIAWFLIGIARNIGYLYVARVIMGMCADIAFTSLPMYVGEIAHPEIRGLLAGFIHIMSYLGTILIYSIGRIVPLYVTPTIGCGILILQLVTFTSMPKSPYFLLNKGRKSEARSALVKLRNTTDEYIDNELREMELSIERQRPDKFKIRDIWLVKSNRKAITIMTLLNLSCNISGITPIVMNMHLILLSSNSIYLGTETCATLFVCILLVGSFLGTFLVDQFGRKILLLNSSIICSILLFILGLYFNLQFLNIQVYGISWVPMVGIMLFAVFFKMGLGIIPIVMTAELFPSSIKAIGMGYADAVYILFASASTYFYHQISQRFGIYVPFYFFSAGTLIVGIFNSRFIPETKGKTLEQIQMMLIKGNE